MTIEGFNGTVTIGDLEFEVTSWTVEFELPEYTLCDDQHVPLIRISPQRVAEILFSGVEQ